MFIDLKKLYSSKDDQSCFSFPFSVEGFSFEGRPLAALQVQRQGGGLLLSLEAEGLLHTRCDLCLEDMDYPCCAKQQYFVKEQDLDMLGADATEDQLPMENGLLDGAELARQELLLQMPIAFHCSDTCEGLCPQCGRPKKYGCNCAAPVDERLQILKQLLD